MTTTIHHVPGGTATFTCRRPAPRPRPRPRFAPMLAATLPGPDAARLPAIAQPKIDGIRCLIVGGRALTRALRPIPNAHIRRALEALDLPDLDGELTCGPATAPDVFTRTQSGVMAAGGAPAFTFHVFDAPGARPCAYEARLRAADAAVERAGAPLRRIARRMVTTRRQLHDHLEAWLADGFEGAVLRAPDFGYKWGRSTRAEAAMVKLKPLDDAEARVVAVEAGPWGTPILICDLPGCARAVRVTAAGAGPADAGRIARLQFRRGTKRAPRDARFAGWRPEMEVSDD